MAQLLPPTPAGRTHPLPDYELGPAAGGRRPVTMRVEGERLYGMLYEPAAPRGRVGVLILEQLSWHRMHHRLAQRLA
ncbi:MAG TPA: hypothetical protein VNM50_08095, partial [Chloroflexota bacterium]|nr:hypothetical protein [Chloroflexota bacterium]